MISPLVVRLAATIDAATGQALFLKCVDQLCTGRACERFPYLFVIGPDRHLLSLCIIGHRGRRGGV